MSIRWRSTDAAVPGTRDDTGLRLVLASGLGGPAAREAQLAADDRAVLSARAKWRAQVGPWPERAAGSWLGWLAGQDGQNRERQFQELPVELLDSRYREWVVEPHRQLREWLDGEGQRRLGVTAGDVDRLAARLLDTVPMPAVRSSLAALASTQEGPASAPPIHEVTDRIDRTLQALGLVPGDVPIEVVLVRDGLIGGWCRRDSDRVLAAVGWTGRYRDLIALWHEVGHAVCACRIRLGPETAGEAWSEGAAHALGQLARSQDWARPWLDGFPGWAVTSRAVRRRVAAASWLAAGGSDGISGWAGAVTEAVGAPVCPGAWVMDAETPRGTLVYLLAVALAGTVTGRLVRLAGEGWHGDRRAGDLLRSWYEQGAAGPRSLAREVACYVGDL